jgi:hypothetical protein
MARLVLLCAYVDTVRKMVAAWDADDEATAQEAYQHLSVLGRLQIRENEGLEPLPDSA